MKKFLLVFSLLCATSALSVKAQDYNWAIGVRGGEPATGITVKHHFDPANGLEGIIDFAKGVNVYALYERHIPVITNGFHFYYGGGLNMGGWEKHSDTKFTACIDGVIGLEYKIPKIPLAVSVDYKPCLKIAGYTGFRALDIGLGFKVAF